MGRASFIIARPSSRLSYRRASSFGCRRGRQLRARWSSQQPDEPVRQGKRHQDEQAAEDEEPEIRRCPGQIALAGVDDDGAKDGADKGAATADGDPDGDLDRICRPKLASVE